MQTLLDACGATRGHFLYESGHHGDLWLDLERLFEDAERARAWTSALAARAAACKPEIVCGPRTGGALVALSVAAELSAGFVFAGRFAKEGQPVRYRIPEELRSSVRGRRVLLVDDAINAGSALRATLAELSECGAILTGMGCLLTLGPAGADIAREAGVPFFALASLERGMWTPAECPLCAAGTPLRAAG